MPNVPPTEQPVKTNHRQARVAHLLALSTSASMVAVALTEVAANSLEETATGSHTILHHPGSGIGELTSITTSLKVFQDVTVCIVDARTINPWETR